MQHQSGEAVPVFLPLFKSIFFYLIQPKNPYQLLSESAHYADKVAIRYFNTVNMLVDICTQEVKAFELELADDLLVQSGCPNVIHNKLRQKEIEYFNNKIDNQLQLVCTADNGIEKIDSSLSGMLAEFCVERLLYKNSCETQVAGKELQNILAEKLASQYLKKMSRKKFFECQKLLNKKT